MVTRELSATMAAQYSRSPLASSHQTITMAMHLHKRRDGRMDGRIDGPRELINGRLAKVGASA